MDDHERDGEAALRAKLLGQLAALARTVGTKELRRALAGSFMISANSEQRLSYDRLREEIDAYLRAIDDGQAAVQRPGGFVDSPDVTAAELEDLVVSVRGPERDPRNH